MGYVSVPFIVELGKRSFWKFLKSAFFIDLEIIGNVNQGRKDGVEN